MGCSVKPLGMVMITCACATQLAIAWAVKVDSEHAKSATDGDTSLAIRADVTLAVAATLMIEGLENSDPVDVWGVLIVTKTSVPLTTAVRLTVGFRLLLLADPTTETLNCEFAASLVANEILAPTFVLIITLVIVEGMDDPENSCAPFMDAEKGVQLA